MEQLILYVISKQAEEKKVIRSSQHGFTKTFDTVSHNILTWKLRKCRLAEWTVRWIEN